MFENLQILKQIAFHRNQSCDIAPKKAAAFDLTFARFCWAVDCDEVATLLAGDFLCNDQTNNGI